jgi:hypothetical protein
MDTAARLEAIWLRCMLIGLEERLVRYSTMGTLLWET